VAAIGAVFRTVGVVLDQPPTKAFEHATRYGQFDELVLGGHWGVAAFLLDLVDAYSPSEPWDTLAFPGSYIANIISSCKVNTNRANGIDHLVLCFEQQVDSALAHYPRPYFSTRLTDYYSQTNSAGTPAGWSQAAVRTTWLSNLYRQ
jgi:hypothetical protein